ncbi:hypothetical protein JCM11251_005481 [Rhodosporidiobolus azoricus]
MSTGRYVRLKSLDTIAASHLPPSSAGRSRVSSSLNFIRTLASSPRHAAVVVGTVIVIGLVVMLQGRTGGKAYELAWSGGRFGPARSYAKEVLQHQLKDVLPQASWKDQLQPSSKYLTAMMFGGQSNQLLAMYNLLYMGKELARTVILPPFTAIHFKGQQRTFHQIYDVPRFYSLTGVPAIPLGYFKSPSDPSSVRDDVTCWSTMELYTGSCNNHQVETGFNAHNIYTSFWAMPHFPRSSDGAVIQFGPLLDFLRNRTARLDWVEETKREVLPQRPLRKDVDPLTVDKEKNLKAFFEPLHGVPPTADEQLMCVDAAFYVGYSVPPPPYPQHIPLEPWRGRAWQEIGQHLHWIPEVAQVADEYLARIFGVKRIDDVPPYISVHIRRGDFKNFKGNTAYTPLKNYAAAVNSVRERLQDRLEFPLSVEEREGKPALRRFKTMPAEYAVLVTSDEDGESDLWAEVDAMGWKTINHGDLKTVETYGEWWPSMLDGEMLSRGQGFVGTQWSTFSMVSGLRVEYWQGGIQVVADPK